MSGLVSVLYNNLKRSLKAYKSLREPVLLIITQKEEIEDIVPKKHPYNVQNK